MIEPKTQAEVVFFLLCNISRLDEEHFDALMDKLEQWKAGKKKDILLSDAYEILKQNVRYSSGDCQGFVYLSQIDELMNKELKANIAKTASGNWIAFDSHNPEARPKKYGKYLICRKDGKIHWETWNGTGWAYNHNEIAYWAEITPPTSKS